MDYNTHGKLQLSVDFRKQLKRKERYSHKLGLLVFLPSSHAPAGAAQEASIIRAGPTVTIVSLLGAYCALISETSGPDFWCEAHAAASLQTEQMDLKVGQWITAKDKEVSAEVKAGAGRGGDGFQGFTLYFSQLQPTLVQVSLFCYWLRAL